MELTIPDNLTIPQFLFQYVRPACLEKFPQAPWMVDSVTGRQYFSAELEFRSRSLAKALKLQYNIGPNEVVCIISTNHVDYATSFWAIHMVGASAFTTNPGFSVEELVPQFRDAKPTLLIVQPDIFLTVRDACSLSGLGDARIIFIDSPSEQYRAAVNGHAAHFPSTLQDLVDFGMQNCSFRFAEFRLKPGEGKSNVAIFFPSSGTTGAPKLIAVSHYAFIANILQAVSHDNTGKGTRRYNPGEVSCAVLPFFHILGFLINLHYPIFSGMTVVVVPKFHFQTYVNSIVQYGVTHLLLVTPMAVLFVKNTAYDTSQLKNLRVVSIAGAPLSELTAEFARLIPQAVIGQIYGMTEAGALTGPSPDASRPNLSKTFGVTTYSVGKLLPGVVSKVVKDNGSLALQGEKGELWVKTPSAAVGYHSDNKSNAETFIDGWLRTGDEVYFDENDELYVVQRIKDFMKVKGFRVNPVEIEARLLEHPDVIDCCVVPIPHEYSGEVPKAYIVLRADAQQRAVSGKLEEMQLKDALLQHAAFHRISYKHLVGGIEFCDSIPKTASGKLLRRVLRGRVINT